jgi:hypothetical protein
MNAVLARNRGQKVSEKLTERIHKGLLSVTRNIAVEGLLRGTHIPVIKSKAS